MSDSKEFVLTNGTKFIRRNINDKYEQVTNITMADTYRSKKQAMNIMLNSIPKSMSRLFYVAEIKDGKLIQSCAPRPPKAKQIRGNKGYRYDRNSLNDAPNWYDGFVGMDKLFQTAKIRNNELSQEISNIESMITDLEHYIEFSHLNAREGYKTYKELHKMLNRRRSLKDEQKVVSAINKNYSALDGINHIIQAVEHKTGNEYIPRLLADLFENGIDGTKFDEFSAVVEVQMEDN